MKLSLNRSQGHYLNYTKCSESCKYHLQYITIGLKTHCNKWWNKYCFLIYEDYGSILFSLMRIIIIILTQKIRAKQKIYLEIMYVITALCISNPWRKNYQMRHWVSTMGLCTIRQLRDYLKWTWYTELLTCMVPPKVQEGKYKYLKTIT